MENAGITNLSKNGQVTYLTEAQVTAIKMQVTAVKLEIQKSHNLRNSPKVHEAKTDLEKAL
jgi:hypothetical protein